MTMRATVAAVRNDFYSFVRATFPNVAPEGKLLRNWHVEAMTYALERVRHGEPFDHHGASAQSEIHLHIGRAASFCPRPRSHTNFICVSYAQSLAEKHANDFRPLMRSSMYQEVFRTRISRAKDTQLERVTAASGFRLITSVGGTLTGRGGNFIILDDPLKRQANTGSIAD